MGSDNYGIPRFAMLDVWVALGGDSQEFEQWMDEQRRTPADAWAQLCAAISGNIAALLADTNPPAEDALLKLVALPVEVSDGD